MRRVGAVMSPRILVADDDEATRQGLKTLLSSWGYEVEVAADGDEALARARTFGPAVVITDLTMPKLAGAELVAGLRGTAPAAAVIVLTGHRMPAADPIALAPGLVGCLEKPVDLRRLRALVEAAVNPDRQARAS
jgi:CheY-like chemotaxis protein